MENNLKLTLGGEERTLIMGKMGFLKNLSKVNKDNLNLLDTTYFADPGKAYDVALMIVKAGILTAGLALDETKVEEWFDDLPLEAIKDIHYAGIAAITQKTVDELKNSVAQAANQNGSTKVL